MFTYSKWNWSFPELIILPLDDLGLQAGELLPPSSQHTVSEGFKCFCTGILFCVQLPTEPPYVTVAVPGFVCISLISALGKCGWNPHGKRFMYSFFRPNVQVCFILKYHAKNKYLKTAPFIINKVDTVWCLSRKEYFLKELIQKKVWLWATEMLYVSDQSVSTWRKLSL